MVATLDEEDANSSRKVSASSDSHVAFQFGDIMPQEVEDETFEVIEPEPVDKDDK